MDVDLESAQPPQEQEPLLPPPPPQAPPPPSRILTIFSKTLSIFSTIGFMFFTVNLILSIYKALEHHSRVKSMVADYLNLLSLFLFLWATDKYPPEKKECYKLVIWVLTMCNLLEFRISEVVPPAIAVA